MGGKGIILIVLGFSIIFLVIGQNFGSLSGRAVDNETKYYVQTTAYNIAVAGANMAANEIFMDKFWDEGYSNLSFSGGIINVYVSNTTSGSTGKVKICHIPPGETEGHTIEIASTAVPAHLAHGDYLGECGGGGYISQIAKIISEGTFNGVTKTVVVELRPSNFAKFGNFYSSISAYPATGDTFNGPFHVNARLTTYGTPVFWGKVTSKNGLTKLGSPRDPKFYGGYEDGIDIPLEFDTAGLRSNADVVFKDTTGNGYKIDVRLYFNSNGTITHSKSINSGSWSTPKTENISSFAPDGIIYVEKGNIYTKGTVNGSLTIVATKLGKIGCGNVYFEDNIIYKDNPVTIPSSDDMLGIVAEENIRIKDNADTRGKNIYTQASMFAQNGNIGPEDGLVTQNFLGNWNILGGLIAKTTRVTATYSGSTPVKGLRFVHTYDERFLLKVPPAFPHTKNFEVVSWYE
ncbi:MAG: hypothetical protein AB1521_11220 [Bacteroidota bacterium]